MPSLHIFLLMLTGTSAFLASKRSPLYHSAKVISSKHVQISCDEGWYPFEDKCYINGSTKLNWVKAAAYCREIDANLVSIHSQEESDFLRAFMLMRVKSNAWIGFHDRVNESKFEWEDGTLVDYTNWEPREPSGLGTAKNKEDCAELIYYPGKYDAEPGQWNDVDCDRKQEFICQKNRSDTQREEFTDPRFCPAPIGGWKLRESCYHVILGKFTWKEAEEYCVGKHDGHLLTINDYSVNLFIEYILRNYEEDMWIGIKMSNKSQQQWSSGWHVSFTDWDWMTDKGDFKEGKCAFRTLKNWATASCEERMPFICETSSDVVPSFNVSEELFCPGKHLDWKDFGGDFCYHINNEHLTWFEANSTCEEKGGSLASFHSQMEMDILQPFLMLHFNDARRLSWIGLHSHMQNGEFMWSDGSSLDFSAWTSNAPNFPHFKCAEVNPKTMKWSSYACDAHRPFICSVRKIAQNETPESKALPHSDSTSGLSKETLISIVICVSLLVILLGILIYYFGFRNKDTNSSIVFTMPVRLLRERLARNKPTRFR